MQFRPKFGMSKKEHLRQSDIFVNAQRHLETRNLPFFLFLGRRILDKKLMDHTIRWAILWQHLPFFLFLGRRILDKKLMDHAI